MGPTAAVTPARPEEWTEAFQLVFQHLPPLERSARVANALRLVHTGDLQRDGILVARGPAGLLGAIVCLPVPGASGLIWPPQVQSIPQQSEVEDLLIHQAGAHLRSRGVKLGQALLAPGEAHLGAPLERNGFAHITSLWYMRHSLSLPFAFIRAQGRLLYRSYRGGDAALFQQTLERTYEASLDCPEVAGVRSMEEVLTGHRSQAGADPGRWWLALDEDRPVGVLLLAEMPEWEAWDVAYVGVVPEERRRGWGREIVAHALRLAHASDAAQLTLSVDARNRPAWKLYLDLGFEPFDHREVYLAVWGRETGD